MLPARLRRDGRAAASRRAGRWTGGLLPADRRRIGGRRSRCSSLPRTRTEQVLAEIWCEVLGSNGSVSTTTSSRSVAPRRRAWRSRCVRTRPACRCDRSRCSCSARSPRLAAEYGPVADEQPRVADAQPAESDDRQSAHAPRAVGCGRTGADAQHGDRKHRRLPACRDGVDRDRLAGCVNEIGIPLERLTGIKHRRVVGDDEFSIDLARQGGDRLPGPVELPARGDRPAHLLQHLPIRRTRPQIRLRAQHSGAAAGSMRPRQRAGLRHHQRVRRNVHRDHRGRRVPADRTGSAAPWWSAANTSPTSPRPRNGKSKVRWIRDSPA